MRSARLYAAAVYLAYEFVPGAESLETHYVMSSPGIPLPEHVVWSIFIQLAAALRTVHSAGFAARCVDPSKALLSCSLASPLHPYFLMP